MAKSESQPISVKDAVHKLQLSLLEGIRTENQLFAAGSLMSRSDYEDVVTERSIANHCGYPLCNNPLPSDRPRKGRYRISLKEHKVYDLHETYMYCCSDCVVNSRTFAGSLQDERCAVSNSAKIDKVLKLFEELGVEEKGELGKKGDLGFSDLKIEEKVDVKVATVPMEDWIGPSNAIEGYVPQSDRSSKPLPLKHGEEGSKPKPKSARPKKGKAKVVNEMDFTSEIIMGDQFSVPEVSSGPKLKGSDKSVEGSKGDQLNNLEASSAPELKISEVKESKGELGSVIVKSQFGIPELLYSPSENVSTGGAKELRQDTSVEDLTRSNGITLKSSVRSSGPKTLKRSVTWADQKKSDNMSNGNLCEFQQVGHTHVLKTAESTNDSNIEVKSPGRNVTGADGRTTDDMSNRNLGEVQHANTQSHPNVEDDNGSERLASAEACVLALSEAAEAVASGVSDITDAVSEAGIIILPQPHGADEDSEKEEDVVEQDLVPFKWPKKPGVFNANLFDAEDSWYDSPPDGLNLTLSAFSTMWMALFGWITSSSLAYIYGQDESSHEEFSMVNGREYPRKVVSSEGRSSEIKHTLAVCLGRALPEVATNLRLKTPISAMEKGLDHLLNTMSFMDALPPFKLKQWHVIILLFLDALSVCRIPGLASHMTSGGKMFHKMLDGAKVSREEYEIMKDLIIPLGRVPQVSAQNSA